MNMTSNKKILNENTHEIVAKLSCWKSIVLYCKWNCRSFSIDRMYVLVPL